MKKFFAVMILAMASTLCVGQYESDESMERERDWGGGKFLVLCYHDVPKRNQGDKYGVDVESFIAQIEFLRSRKCSFVSLGDILAANKGGKKLPPKAVLLTFDDAYESFYKNVFPILRLYKIPAVLAVVTDWIDHPPSDYSFAGKMSKPAETPANITPLGRLRFMTWAQIREVAGSGLVDVASHTSHSHKAVQINPQGGTSAAVISRVYEDARKEYESEAAYASRVGSDLEKSYDAIKAGTGAAPLAMVWPYGRYNKTSAALAAKVGFKAMLTLDDGLADVSNLDAVPRFMLENNVDIGEFARMFRRNFKDIFLMRAAQADLDLIYDVNPSQTNRNIDAFIERMSRLKPSTVFLQAYADPEGDGNISSVYFPNSVLPMRADLFSRVARALIVREIQVYAWMPMLSIVLPDKAENDALRVRERRGGRTSLATSWYTNRLSPFSEKAADKLVALYGDMASICEMEGVIFQDDGYLNDFEDFHPDAMREYRKITGGRDVEFSMLLESEKDKWTDLKTDRLNGLTVRLMAAVRKHRPKAFFARTIYPTVVTEPETEEWFAQNYEKCLGLYDYTVIMAYPRMENVKFPERWLREVVRRASKYPGALEKTVFKVQAYDWDAKKWIGADTVNSWLRALVAAGARHTAYYPDDFTVNEPDMERLKKMISTRDFPYVKK